MNYHTFVSVLLTAILSISLSPAQESVKTPRNITIAAVGDIMIGSDFPQTKLPSNDRSFLQNVKQYFAEADILMGNLEAPLCDGGLPHKTADFATTYVFRTPTRYVKGLADAGFDFLSLANNHFYDFGRPCADETKKTLDAAGISYSSVDGEVAGFDIDGISVAVIGVTFGRSPRSLIYPDKLLEEIKGLSAQYDIVVISAHAGTEGPGAMQAEDKEEFFQDEPRGNVVRFSRMAIDNGADLIIGHGPHVPRAMEIYKGRLIAYSLGNFYTFRGVSIVDEKGYAPLVTVELDRSGKFIKGNISSFIQKDARILKKDADNRALQLIRKLSQTGFPNTKPVITAEGDILP